MASILGRLRRALRGTRPPAGKAGAPGAIDAPHLLPDVQCEWISRPAPWREAMETRDLPAPPSPTHLAGGVTLHHDATQPDLSLRQAPANDGAAPFEICLDVRAFDGSFVSLVHDLPDEAVADLTLDHYVALHIRMARDRPIEVYARLNIRHGPNTEQLVRHVDFEGEAGVAEFDLGHAQINERRIEKAWLDIIIERPATTRITFRDVIVLRALRADV
ncbi:DUF6478 family protein [Roseibacterium sp. SDUM158017]|nr:DUF6478 family protein [Roseibacterium sp. SDUM158017]